MILQTHEQIDANENAGQAGERKELPLQRRQFSLRSLFAAITAVAIILGLCSHWIGWALIKLLLSPFIVATVVIGFVMLIQLPFFILLHTKGTWPSKMVDASDQETTE